MSRYEGICVLLVINTLHTYRLFASIQKGNTDEDVLLYILNFFSFFLRHHVQWCLLLEEERYMRVWLCVCICALR